MVLFSKSTNAPAFFCCCGDLDTRPVLKNPVAISLEFDHSCYRGLTNPWRFRAKWIPVRVKKTRQNKKSTSGDQQTIGHDRHEADQHRPQREGRHQENIVHPLGALAGRIFGIVSDLSVHWSSPRFL